MFFVFVTDPSYGGSRQFSSGNLTASRSRRARVRINTEFLCRHWVNSREEERQPDKEEIYRPKNFKVFPPSEFRMQYIFHKNGDCEWYYLAPNDAHHFKSGKWRIDPNDNAVIQIIKNGATESYRVTALTGNLLRISVMTPTKWAQFVELSRPDVCSSIRNRLFVIDDVLVFHDSAGNCNDAGYSEVLFGKTIDNVLCSYADSKAGPRKSCRNPKYAGLFDTIITHLNEPDLGLGPGHTFGNCLFET
jgi:hypothetical protein